MNTHDGARDENATANQSDDMHGVPSTPKHLTK